MRPDRRGAAASARGETARQPARAATSERKVLLFHSDAALRACLTAVALVRGLIVSWLDCTFSAGSAKMATFEELWEIGRGNVIIC